MTTKDFFTPLFDDLILIIFVGRLGLLNSFQVKKSKRKNSGTVEELNG
jgi:hypothetical protein